MLREEGSTRAFVPELASIDNAPIIHRYDSMRGSLANYNFCKVPTRQVIVDKVLVLNSDWIVRECVLENLIIFLLS
jgi:hypothetical protein